MKKFESFERTHTKGAKKLSKKELVELERLEMKKYKEDQKEKNKQREERVKKKQQRLERELAKKAREEEKKRREEARKKREEAIANGEDVPELEEGDEELADEPEEDEEEVDEEVEEENVEGAGEGSEFEKEAGEPSAVTLDKEKFPDQIEEEEDVSFKIKNRKFYFNYNISTNSKLIEYYTEVKKGLRSLFVCGKISLTSLFSPRSITQKESLTEIAKLLPTFHFILNKDKDEFCLEKITDFKLRDIFKDLTNFGVGFDDIAHHIAIGLTIARRTELMKISELNVEQISQIGANIYQALKVEGYTNHQILGIVDCKYAEAASIRSMATKLWKFRGDRKVSSS